MTLQIAVVSLLALAAILGSWRAVRHPTRWRGVRVVVTIAAAVALYFVLFPPMTERAEEARIVLTPGVTAEQIRSLDRSRALVALPGVAADDDNVETVPDLATALRRHPQITRLDVFGFGLPARDREAIHHTGMTFESAPMPFGILELHAPRSVMAGSLWNVSGRVESGKSDLRIELRDRADALLDTAMPDASGHFTLRATKAAVARSIYRLCVYEIDGALLEDFPLAIDVHDAQPMQVLVIAGAPDAELKYLRRWAADADVAMASRVQLSRGIQFLEHDASLDATALEKADLLIVDERAWAAFGKSTKAAIHEAVDQGLGLLLRVTGPVPASVANEWAAFGLRLESDERATTIALRMLPDVKMTRRPLKIAVEDSVTLLDSVDDIVLARWRASGLGRVALWTPLDTYRLTLAGHDAEFGTLWSGVFSTLARARGENSAQMPRYFWIGERAVLCDIAEDSSVENSRGERTALLVQSACAAFWPSTAGWHNVIADDVRGSFYVFDRDEARALAAAETAQATRALVRDAERSDSIITMSSAPRWPFFLIWIGISALLWWLERARPSHAAR